MQFKFNIPNKITLIRVSLIPLFAVILLIDIPYKNILAAFIFGMLSVSDFLDGYFARKKKQVTQLGKLIDFCFRFFGRVLCQKEQTSNSVGKAY
ncbi:CDP-alcohol phosphatidyltransferase family protein [Candidatus Woesearchaeota archaeon]|nr:CDP-alcohol phosphatidyltransferase family protein [Candidatus Woesearchaeota archaeon]